MGHEGEVQKDRAGEGAFVSDYLLYLLAASSEAASAQFHDRVRAEGLRVPEWRVLACLVDQPHVMLTQLARLSLMEQSRMTRIVAQMEERGLIARTPDARDKRRVWVALTQAGQTLADRLVRDARAHEAALLSSLADTDAAMIRKVLQTLLAVVSGDDPAPSAPARKDLARKDPAHHDSEC